MTTIGLKNLVQRVGRRVTIGLLALLAVAVAGSWLIAVYMLNGRALLNETKSGIQTTQAVQVQTINTILTRSIALSEHISLMALLATPEYFQVAAHQDKNLTYDPTKSFVFIVNEDTHMDDLPLTATPVQLRVNGGEVIAPSTLEMVTYSSHHKVSIATFPKVDASGQSILGTNQNGTLELVSSPMDSMSMSYNSSAEVSMKWDLPIIYPEGSLKAQTLPFGSMIAIAMGLLATVLTPCLLQLLVFYLSTLVGTSAENLAGVVLEPAIRRRLFKVALGFVFGYTLIFSLAGGVAGYAGQTLQSAWGTWVRPMAIISGIIIILMGLWMAIRSRAPLVCRLPIYKTKLGNALTGEGGFFRSTIMGLTFAVGCATCFGGALIATLLLYVGTLGSPVEGALILFLFSLGVGIPFLLSAALLTRVLPLVQRMQRYLPAIGLVSSTIMVIFGILLITDNFHKVSNMIYPLLGLK